MLARIVHKCKDECSLGSYGRRVFYFESSTESGQAEGILEPIRRIIKVSRVITPSNSFKRCWVRERCVEPCMNFTNFYRSL